MTATTNTEATIPSPKPTIRRKSAAQVKRKQTVLAKTWQAELDAQVARGIENAKVTNEAKDRAYQMAKAKLENKGL